MAVQPVRIDSSRIINNRLEARVRSEDFGDANVGGIHVFDNAGNSTRFDLGWLKKGADRGQDLFAGSIPLSEIQARGLDIGTLKATAYVKVEGNTLWEGLDANVAASPRDRVVDMGLRDQRSNATYPLRLYSGEMTLNILSQFGNGSRESGITSISFRPTNDYFQNAATLEVEVFPEYMHDADPAGAFGLGGRDNRYGIRQQNQTEIITLTRQADGSYRSAELPPNNAYFYTPGSTDRYRSRRQTALNFSLVDPVTRRIDDRFGDGYQF